MTVAYEAYGIVRAGDIPIPRVGVVELLDPAEALWTADGIAQGVAFMSVARHADGRIHVRAQGTDKPVVKVVAQRVVTAVALREPIPADDVLGPTGVG